jgi:hypothetical protein
VTLDQALDEIRAQSTFSDDEWKQFVAQVEVRAGLRHSDVIGEVPSSTDMHKISAWMTVHQLASVLGIDPGLARQWKLRGKLPKPDEMIGGRAVWSRRTVKLFCQQLEEMSK